MGIDLYIKQQIEKYETVNNYYKHLTQSFIGEKEHTEILEALCDTVKAQIKPEKIDTIEDLAQLLNNNSNGSELNNESNIDVEDLCLKNKWVILFPYSDDNIEIRGFIDDELGAWDGGYFKLIKKGDFYKDYDEENTYHKAEYDSLIRTDEDDCDVIAKWCDDTLDKVVNKRRIWNYEVASDKYPYAYFYIHDEDEDADEIWARCIIFDLSKEF